MTIKEKLDIIKCNVENSKINESDSITIIAVTKTIEPNIVNEVLENGFLEIGENYVQEFLGKFDYLKEKVSKFHFIGHLQSNKVKYIIDKVDLIHSVDSISLLKEINKQASKINKIQDVLIEVNLTKEDSKFGIYEENLDDLIENAKLYSNVNIKGLMTMPPIYFNDSDTKNVFLKLNNIYAEIKNKYNYDNIDMKYLSMGMSKDYMLAIQCGANMVRLGTTIFGKREVKPPHN